VQTPGPQSNDRLIAVLPAAPETPQWTYVLQTLLPAAGLAVEARTGEAGATDVELAWPGGGGVRVEPSRLRQAFREVSGLAERDAPRDMLGRVTAEALGEDRSRPVWSQWAWELAGELARRNPAWRPPEKRLTVHLTHDVDRVRPFEIMGVLGRTVRAAGGALRGDLAACGRCLGWLAKGGRLAEAYDRIMRAEQEAGAVATYYFMSGPYSFRRYGSRGGCSGRLRRLLAMARRYGHRIGLHGCAYSLRRADYARQRRRLSRAAGEEITWHRNHYLVFDAAESPGQLAGAGLRVDSTCGFHDANVFRAGLAHAYRLWDPKAGGPGEVLEVPLVFMDSARGGTVEQDWAELYQRLEQAEAVGGTVAVLIHVEYFVEVPGAAERYGELLGWLGARRAVLDAGGRETKP
jgi:hypothetical protein